MDKYRLFERIIKTKSCTFYRAEQIESREGRLVKKLHQQMTWQQILKDRDLGIFKEKHVKYFIPIKEMVKDENMFYLIMEPIQENLQLLIKQKMSRNQAFQIGRNLIQMIMVLNDEKIIARQLRPSYLFLCNERKNIKLAHLQTVCKKNLAKLDLVELEDLRYLSPEQVLTTRDLDQRSMVFCIGLIFSEMLLGNSLITANTKMSYMYELCRLFPEDPIDKIQGSQHNMRYANQGSTFEQIMSEANISNQMIALLRQILKIDRNDRIPLNQLIEAFDLIVQNEEQFLRNKNIIKIDEIQNKKQFLSEQKPKNEIIQNQNHHQANQEIQSKQLEFNFQNKPTLSIVPPINITTSILPHEMNIEDDVSQPIVIKQSKKIFDQGRHTQASKQTQKSNVTAIPSLTTIRKPQLTNYALNQANVGVKLGFNPTFYSQNQTDF